MVYWVLPSMNSILFSFFFMSGQFPSNNTKCSGGQNSLRSDIVHITFSYSCSHEPAPSFTSTQHFRASRPSVLSLKKTSLRHSSLYVYFRTFCLGVPMSTRLLWTLCVCPMSSCLKLSRGNMYVSNPVLLAWNYRKHITHTTNSVCVCYITVASS